MEELFLRSRQQRMINRQQNRSLSSSSSVVKQATEEKDHDIRCKVKASQSTATHDLFWMSFHRWVQQWQQSLQQVIDRISNSNQKSNKTLSKVEDEKDNRHYNHNESNKRMIQFELNQLSQKLKSFRKHILSSSSSISLSSLTYDDRVEEKISLADNENVPCDTAQQGDDQIENIDSLVRSHLPDPRGVRDESMNDAVRAMVMDVNSKYDISDIKYILSSNDIQLIHQELIKCQEAFITIRTQLLPKDKFIFQRYRDAIMERQQQQQQRQNVPSRVNHTSTNENIASRTKHPTGTKSIVIDLDTTSSSDPCSSITDDNPMNIVGYQHKSILIRLPDEIGDENKNSNEEVLIVQDWLICHSSANTNDKSNYGCCHVENIHDKDIVHRVIGAGSSSLVWKNLQYCYIYWYVDATIGLISTYIRTYVLFSPNLCWIHSKNRSNTVQMLYIHPLRFIWFISIIRKS
jgi:hypothetical protein